MSVLVVTAPNPEPEKEYFKGTLVEAEKIITCTKFELSPKHKVKQLVLIMEDSNDSRMFPSPLFKITKAENRSTLEKSMSLPVHCTVYR